MGNALLNTVLEKLQTISNLKITDKHIVSSDRRYEFDCFLDPDAKETITVFNLLTCRLIFSLDQNRNPNGSFKQILEIQHQCIHVQADR